VGTLAELNRRYPGIAFAKVDLDAAMIFDAAVVQGTNLLSLLALEVRTVMLMSEDEATRRLEELRRRRAEQQQAERFVREKMKPYEKGQP
jgi:hypothetical protein